MLEFFFENWGTLLIGIIVALIVVLIIIKLAKDRRKGKSSCGCNCSHCPSSGMCHIKK